MSSKKTEITPREGLDLAPAIQAAVELGPQGVEVLERLQAILREQRKDDAVEAYHRALAAAKAEFPEIRKTYAGPHTTKKGGITVGNYAPLHEIAKAIDPALNRHGLHYRWDREREGSEEYVVCIISHERGHSERSRFPAKVDEGRGRSTIQSIASGETYAKRYSLISALGLATVDPDDDAEATHHDERVSEEQAANVQAALEEAGGDAKAKLLAWLRVDSIAEIPKARLPKVWEAIDRLRAKA